MTSTECEQRVLDVVRTLALEVGGSRALQAVSPTASLEREIGFGSLERVELLLRLETALDRELGDRFLLMDTPCEIARAVAEVAERIPVERTHPVFSPVPIPPAPLATDTLETVVEALWMRAVADPTRVHVHLESAGGVHEITFGALRDGAAVLGASLAKHGGQPGQAVAIMLPTGFDFLQSFMGVLAAGMIPVPLYPPPRLDRLEDYLLRQTKILANAEARLLITFPEAAPVTAALRSAVPSLTGIVTASTLREHPQPPYATQQPIEHPHASRDDVALIQYTSGSTGDPKGVSLTHANLLANIRAIAAGLALSPTDVAVSWLPLYHDMGLIGTWLSSIVYGIPLTLMSPLSFLAQPDRWLWAIHRRRATLSAAPNFAYELCLRKIRDDTIDGLDLSSWRCAINGSEPVSASTLDRFGRRFKRFGLRPDALMPVYGLAECSVALTFPPIGRAPLVDHIARAPFEQDGHAVPAAEGDPLPITFVSVGRALPKHELRLVDPMGHEVAERVVGRLLFRGPSTMAAYHHNPEATTRAVLPDGWIESGDLAYQVAGECFITGRAKDLIIKGGRHVIPQELEEIAGNLDGIRKGCVVAFGVPDETAGTERLVLVAESHAVPDDERQTLESAVIERIATATGIPPDVVRIVPPGTVPKTSSGKIRRADARRLYLSGRLGHSRPLPLRLRVQLLRGRAEAISQDAVSRAGRGMYAVYLAVVTAVAGITLGIPLWILATILPGRRPACMLERLAARITLWLSGVRVTADGLEHLPRTGPAVLVSNHASYADVLALVTILPRNVVFMAKAELLRWPLVGTFIRKGQHLTVEREDPIRSLDAAKRVTEALKRGEAVLFFPEATFTRALGLRPFRMGAFEAAVTAHAPLVPVAIRGTRQVLGSGMWLPHPGRIFVWIGEPVTAEHDGWQGAQELRDRAAAIIAAQCGEPRLDLVASGVAPPPDA